MHSGEVLVEWKDKVFLCLSTLSLDMTIYQCSKSYVEQVIIVVTTKGTYSIVPSIQASFSCDYKAILNIIKFLIKLSQETPFLTIKWQEINQASKLQLLWTLTPMVAFKVPSVLNENSRNLCLQVCIYFSYKSPKVLSPNFSRIFIWKNHI